MFIIFADPQKLDITPKLRIRAVLTDNASELRLKEVSLSLLKLLTLRGRLRKMLMDEPHCH